MSKVIAMKKPRAIIINDIHYNINTLSLADVALRKAIHEANFAQVPLIVAGDLHDSKANLRAECVNAMIETFKLCDQKPYVLIGNHCRINEKSEEHSLNFLAPYVVLVEKPYCLWAKGLGDPLYLISYHHDSEKLKQYLKTFMPKEAILIMHQGIQGSNSGDYIQDKSAITKDDVSGLRVISGHYHQRQDIKLPNDGLWTYTGNPYTLNYGEANDPEKGFHVLMDDGSLEFVSTNLRKHVVIELGAYESYDLISGPSLDKIGKDDLVWVKIVGTKEQLVKINKSDLSKELGLESFRLELKPVDQKIPSVKTKPKSQFELLDSIIDSLTSTEDQTKVRLKDLWKGFL